MHIKKIIIQGFKTYKNTTVIDFISPHHNVVVGRNGSGKSNFFAAIRFVLSDAYTHMTREERQGLIHEGSGTVMSAYVEIIFDNTERRFPVAKDEVSIRRTIGLKKDDYSLDSKAASRSDVMNLLESAGFSRSNPYYIVPQGRITALTNSKDAERLTLLKEVSGAKVFENKLKESLKEMSTSNLKKERIEESLASIEERLNDLQIESLDLQEFQMLEKLKKCLEFNLFDRELNEVNLQVEAINLLYDEMLSNSSKDLEELDEREKLSRQLLELINEMNRSLKIAAIDKEQSSSDYNLVLEQKTKLEFSINELKQNMTAMEEQTESYKTNIEHYEQLISKREAEISEYKPEMKENEMKEIEIKAKLTELQTKQRALYSKQNRFSKFKNKSERDEWLGGQITQSTNELAKKTTEMNEVQSKLSKQSQELGLLETKITTLDESMNGEEMKKEILVLQDSITDLRSQITDLTDARKSLWRDEIRLRSVQDSIENDLSNATHSVNQTMDRNMAAGLQSVKEISKKLNLSESVLGPLAELFTVNDKYKSAVEAVAGNALFHIAVDTDKTASLLMDELSRNSMGRATFIPLNRVHLQDTKFPNSEENECFPLIKKLKFKDDRVLPALKLVFGKTLLVSNLEKGAELAKVYKVNCITLDGDTADNKGVLTGGFRDYKKSTSRIDALKTLSKKKHEMINNLKLLDTCLAEIEAINPKLTFINNDLQTKIRKQDSLLSSMEPIKVEISKLSDSKFNKLRELDILETKLSSIKAVEENLKINLKQHELELNSEFVQSLSFQEQMELSALSSDILKLEKELDEVVTHLAEIETKVSTYQSDLTNNYYPYLAKLKQEHENKESFGNVRDFSKLETELERILIELDTADLKNQAATDSFDKLQSEVNKSEELVKKSNKQQSQIMKKLEKFQESSERELSKKSVLIHRREEIQRKIRDLGVLPEEAFQQDKFDIYGAEDLLRQLNTVNEKLSKYSHINKKAMEQFKTFTKQRDELLERLNELDSSRDSIELLMQNLESQKDAAITKSFREVSDSFSRIFEKLVPAGIGRLIMQTEDAQPTQTTATQEISNYVGVSISVSFNSKSDEQQRIEQLSGGQKSLCAIALILAIQSCDPVPFYLFDEIDANLDTQYRTAVASMINSLSSRAQFICTTFRPEMLKVADKFYGVMFNNKVSSVSEIDREEAMTFIEGQRVN